MVEAKQSCVCLSNRLVRSPPGGVPHKAGCPEDWATCRLEVKLRGQPRYRCPGAPEWVRSIAQMPKSIDEARPHRSPEVSQSAKLISGHPGLKRQRRERAEN